MSEYVVRGVVEWHDLVIADSKEEAIKIASKNAIRHFDTTDLTWFDVYNRTEGVREIFKPSIDPSKIGVV